MNLSNKKCVPCKGGTTPIPSNMLEEYLGHVEGWGLGNQEKSIEKGFKFKNFIKSIEFVNKVGEIAEISANLEIT